jgi:hypothetical protein
MLCFDVPADLQAKIGEALLAGDAMQYGQGQSCVVVEGRCQRSGKDSYER